ncbi:MAG: c-type cytochrome [Chitinophagaceae bacterium]|nr:c-type cytochrome [Chitinophagaceae bacterium]
MKKVHYMTIIAVLAILVVLLGVDVILLSGKQENKISKAEPLKENPILWTPPDTAEIPSTENGNLIRYGRNLIVHTAQYFGPEGSISQSENGLNCQNCHLAAGTRLFGNNFSTAASSYPIFRARANRYISLSERVNGCMERSMNGKAIDSAGREMKAIIAYLKWIGQGVNKNERVLGAGTKKLVFMSRAADPQRGKVIFVNNCASCHGLTGEGKLNTNGKEYLYPPLWGPRSYNMGAGFYRISKLASFVKNNMPFGTTYHDPVLTDEQAWDVAAYVNSQPHPVYRHLQNDWKNVAAKPFDYPFGPYADTFSERQHKYGPFSEIKK